jgi:dTDP-4-amino-4,6-dideoxygalactose transaminase
VTTLHTDAGSDATGMLTQLATSGDRIYLSAPDMRPLDRELLLDAFDSNWVAPLGPHVDAFEREVANACGRLAGAATSSGTAALHLALRLVGVGPGSDVLMPTLSFVATANAAAYLGARPAFVDVDASSWTMDVPILAEELRIRSRAGRRTGAVVAVDLYGQCADYDALTDVCDQFDVPLIIDAAESLGATYRGQPAGSAGTAAIVSFNGNKIVTCGGGGMLVTNSEEFAEKTRWLSAQARESGIGYHHEELGYNYRLSNLLAAVGRGQVAALADRIRTRRAINDRYRRELADLPGVTFMPVHPRGAPNYWLTCILLDPDASGTSPGAVIKALDGQNIEARPAWKPLHAQPLYANCSFRDAGVASRIAARGICLPSGSGLTPAHLDKIVDVLRRALSGP